MRGMRKVFVLCLALVIGFCFVTTALAQDKKAEIKKQVDAIVMGINGGKKPADYQETATKEPYVFIMEENGNMLSHPSLTGQNVKATQEPVYKELTKATADGTWVDYTWQGKQKHTYVRKTSGNLIVGSGYSD